MINFKGLFFGVIFHLFSLTIFADAEAEDSTKVEDLEDAK